MSDVRTDADALGRTRSLATVLWTWLARPSARFSLGALLLAGIVAGMVLLMVADWSLHATSSEAFCRSCHEMEQTSYREYQTGPHDQNRSGVRATCPDCHVPHDLLPKIRRKIAASSEVFHHLTGQIDTVEAFEEHRREMAQSVWRAMKDTDSRECRSCHAFDRMDLARQSDRARDSHVKAETSGETCIDCHKGIAHRLPRQ
jgi:cytochrome c-type protein NapC